MSGRLSETSRAKIELINLIRDLQNKIACEAFDRARHLLSHFERASSEPQ